MANDLTGDFDIVAQFALPAVNRLLAAMHRIERFPHSLSLRVEDITPPIGPPNRPSFVAVSDAFGAALANHQIIGNPPPAPGQASAGGRNGMFDSIVNFDLADLQIDPVTPSTFRGHAQAQVFPPTVEIADASANRLTVRLGMMCRYLPDPNTPRAAEFVRGDITITAPVSQISSQTANVINIDVKANTAAIAFDPAWSSTPISIEDRAGINLLMRNALKTSFLPSNIALPSQIGRLQFKALSGPRDVIAALIDSEAPSGNPGTANTVFLGSSDDFAFAAGSDFITAAFQPTIDKILSEPIEPFSFSVNLLFSSYNVTYTVRLNSATVALEPGRIMLTILGRAETGSSLAPNFNFTVKQPFTLEVSGDTADLVAGDLSLDTSSWIVDRFRGGATQRISHVRDRALSQSSARAKVRRMLSAEVNLGGFFRSLLKPVSTKPVPPGPAYSLSYSAVEIQSSGIILHGSLEVAAWPPPHVEFEQVPTSNTGQFTAGPIGGVLTYGPEYSALNSWVPGGTIDRFEWGYLGQPSSGHIDDKKFIYRRLTSAVLDVAPFIAVSGYSPLCLTVRGTRLSASGPVSSKPVSAGVCSFSSFPLLELLSSSGGIAPMVLLTRASADGKVEVTGRTPAATDIHGTGRPNLLVHFPGGDGANRVDALSAALTASGRDDAATAILVVLNEGEATRSRHVADVIYAENTDAVWSRHFDIASPRGQVTLIVDPQGKVMWKHEGEIDPSGLAETLRKSLVKRSPVKASLIRQPIRIGHYPPNFIFEHAPNQELTLRKLAGRDATLIFVFGSTPEDLADLRAASIQPGKGGTALVIAAGRNAPQAAAIVKESGLNATGVGDADWKITKAYGISISPTIVTIEAGGAVTSVVYGRSGAVSEHPHQKPTKERSS